MRASEIYPVPKVFNTSMHPTDIIQGRLGDCYFLATLSGLAENPENVEDLVLTKEVNSAGIYAV